MPTKPSLPEVVAALLRRDPAVLCTRLALTHGGVARLPIPGRRKFWVVSDPECLHRILVTDATQFDKGGPIYRIIADALGEDGLFTVNDEATWRLLRQIMNPAFRRAELRTVMELTAEAWRSRMDAWDLRGPIELFSELKLLSVEVLVRHALGNAVDTAELTRLALPVFDGMAGRIFLPHWAPGASGYRKAIAALDDRVRSIISSRRDQGTEAEDLLGRLMTATDPQTGHRLSDRQVRDQVFTLLMAGFDSTATVLSWACVLMAERGDQLDRLRTEVADVCADRTPTLEDLPRLVTVQALLQESLRLHPAFPMFFRNVKAETRLGRHRLAVGDQIIIAPYATHRDPARWPDPAGFDSGRFAGRLDHEQRAAYLPFGEGKRKCIGEDMATMTGLLILAMLAQRFAAFRRPDGHSGQAARYAMTRPSRDNARLILTPIGE